MTGTIYIWGANADKVAYTVVDHYDFKNQQELLAWLQRRESQNKLYSISFA